VTVLAVGSALGAAAGFAVSTSLQQRAAHAAPASAHLLAHLVRRPAWLLGMLAGGAAFALHAVAVRAGALALVQPLMVSGIVFALPVRAALDRRIPSAAQLAWAGVTALGLALLVVAADPVAGQGTPRIAPALGLVALGGILALIVARITPASAGRTGRGLLLGAAAGVLFGLVAGMLKVTVLASGGVLGAVASWPGWVLLALGISGLALNQRAYHLAALSVTMPVLNVVAPLVAIAFGYLVLDERPATTVPALLAEGAGLALMALGVFRLARFEPPGPESPGPARIPAVSGVQTPYLTTTPARRHP